MSELFPDLPPAGTYKATAYPAPPGTGPEGKQCRDCVHFHRQQGGSKAYSKCDLRSMSHGTATDISMYSPSCAFFGDANE